MRGTGPTRQRQSGHGAGRLVTRTRPAPAASKSRVAHEWIRERITSGAFGPGHRLVLTTLAAQLGMSVVPVREAISHLTAEGLVTFEPHVGASVSMADPDRYVHAMEVITVLESAATARAAPHLTPRDLAHARELNVAMRGGLGDFDFRRFTALNQEFHAGGTGRAPAPHRVPRRLPHPQEPWRPRSPPR